MNCPHCSTQMPDEARFCAACGKATHGTVPSSTPGGTESPADPIGKEIAGRYRILGKLGEGGMGAVYKAEQISLKRQCAVKVLRPDVASAQIMLRRFNAEAEAVAKLSHPNTVNIYDFGQDTDGTFFIAMEYVEGQSLRQVIHTEAPLPIQRALHIASQIAASLVDAHAQSIVHRDLKPDNVLLQTRGRQKDVARVLDFGIAKLRDEGRATQAAMTQAGDMLGTPQYMAPEQIRAEQIDGRTDIYALGCMLYEMITARLPFEGPTLMALLSKHLMETPPPPSQRRPELQIPPVIDELIMSAIAKDPNQRPPTMEMFGERINQILATMPGAPMSAPMSAVHGAVVPVPTPPAGQYGYAATPMPGGAATPMPNMGVAPTVPTPQPPPGMPPQLAPATPPPPAPMAGYGTPQAQYSPYATPTPPPATGKSNNVLLFVILAVVAVAAIAGVLFVFVFNKDKKADDEVITDVDKKPVVAEDDKKPTDDKKPEVDDKKPEADPADRRPTDPTGDDDPEDDPPDDDSTETDVWDSPSGTASSSNSVVDDLKNLRDKMCACRDAACAARVGKDMQVWSVELSKHAADMTSLGPAGAKKISDYTQEFTACMQKVMGIQVPTQTATPPRKLDPLAQVNAFANRACKCTNAACARAVLNDVVAFVRANPSVNNTTDKRFDAAGQRMGRCLVTAGLPLDELQAAVAKF